MAPKTAVFAETSLGGVMNFYEGKDAGQWKATYTRSKNRKGGDLKDSQLLNGEITFEKVTVEGETIKFGGGAWKELSGNHGHIKSMVMTPGKSFKGEFTMGSHGTEAFDWSSEKPCLPGTPEYATLSLLPTQLKWVENFNAHKPDVCADLYSEDATFVMYSAQGEGKDATFKGREAIRGWWRTVVNDMGFKNLQASDARTVVIGDNQVWVEYGAFTMDTPAAAKGFGGKILGETWVREVEKSNEWRVWRDWTAAKVEMTADEEKATLADAGKDQAKWPAAFNEGNWQHCGGAYCEKEGFFCGYNGGGPDVTALYEGREGTLTWWKTVIADMGMKDMAVSGRMTQRALSPNLVAAQYEKFTFGQKDKAPGEIGLQGQILLEVWQKNASTGVWEVNSDFVAV